MRFKKGTKVEVLNKQEIPSGSWWCGEIISGNGHTYNVQYDRYLVGTNSSSERVSRKFIRPCPPPLVGPRCWSPGDIVELFDNNSWKLAEVTRAPSKDYFFVRLLGSCAEYRVRSLDIRMRQAWQDNKWDVIEKESGKLHRGMINLQPKEGKKIFRKPTCLGENNCAGEGHFRVDTTNSVPQSKAVKKRLRTGSLIMKSCTKPCKKLKANDKERSNHQVAPEESTNICENASQKILGEMHIHASLSNINEKSYDNCYFGVSSEPNDAESVSSSVGSCSSNNSPYRLLQFPRNVESEDMYSDAESLSLGREPSHATEEVAGEDIHLLELHAYRTTLKALYASGPISWDQESLMTNLRYTLHISNDEHLLEGQSWRL